MNEQVPDGGDVGKERPTLSEWETAGATPASPSPANAATERRRSLDVAPDAATNVGMSFTLHAARAALTATKESA